METLTALVIPLFLGLRHYSPESSFGSKWRPYASAEIGPLIGHESASKVGSVIATESITRAAAGARLGAGLDIQLGGRMMLGFLGGYNLMTGFSEAIGGEENHSGPDFGISISVLFGGGP